MIESEKSLFGHAGKVVLISGAGAGIGEAAALLFAQLGAKVVAVDKDAGRAGSLRAKLGADHLVIEADVVHQAAEIIETTRSRFGRLDVLVNNVGDFLRIKGSFEETTEEDWQALYEVNLLHMFRMTKAALPLMKAGGSGGSIINLSTIEAFRGIPEVVAYAAFKAGVTGFTKSLAVELGRYNIRVNAVAPETTNSVQITATARVPAENQEDLKRWFPIGRFGEGRDSAGAILYLASDTLAGWVTGSTILVDGGAYAAGSWLRMRNDQWTHLPVIDRDGYTEAGKGAGQ